MSDQYHAIIACADGGFYVCEYGHQTMERAKDRGKEMLRASNDLGILGYLFIDPQASESVLSANPAGNFLQFDTSKPISDRAIEYLHSRNVL